jgi:CheY-like chemotaxis protein/anti-sigma regulatory factor (Ser/Thr protein kinase)
MTAIADKNINDPHHVRECLRKIALSSNHLLTLINDILDISKIESGQYSINPIVFSLSDLMDNIFNVVRPNVRSKQLSLEIHAHHIEQEYLYADQLRLSQIYINILSNAVKYTNPGGKIVVDLYEEPSPLLTGGVRLTYRVADTGIGMRKEFMERMYDTFSRENDGRVDTIQGTGLGLAITKQLVDLMHGTIEAESELGVGSTFTVTLDLAAAEHMTDNIMLPNIRLIVIDDDPILLESAKETLLQIGIDADLANSGATGLQMVLNGHRVARDYRVVILDWSIPDMSGLEVTRRIRAELGADIPIIIVSAYDYSEIEQQALDAGANGFISKPLFKSTLFKTLCELLNIDEQKHDEESKKYSIEGMRILVAEDNDLNYEIAEYLLEDEGAQCTRAENGQVCVDLLQKDPAGFDLVLMDMQMPVMKGLEATQIIRSASDPLMQTIPIIAMTADAFAENVEECLNAGMDGHIAKPIEMTRVLAEIEKVMRSRGRSS